MLLNLIAIDPGGETGVAHALYKPKSDEPPHITVVKAFKAGRGEAFQVMGSLNDQCIAIREFLLEIMTKAGQGKQRAYDVRTILVYEGFVLHPYANLHSDALSPVELAAKLTFYLWLEPETDGKVDVRMQLPSEMQVISDDMLRRWGLWQPGKSNDDAMPALKHLIVLSRKLQKELKPCGSS